MMTSDDLKIAREAIEAINGVIHAVARCHKRFSSAPVDGRDLENALDIVMQEFDTDRKTAKFIAFCVQCLITPATLADELVHHHGWKPPIGREAASEIVAFGIDPDMDIAVLHDGRVVAVEVADEPEITRTRH